MNRLGGRIIELAMCDARSGRDALHLARLHYRCVAHAVFMRARAADDVADDFAIAVRVCAEAFAALHPVFVKHAQAAKPRVFRIIVVREGKWMLTVQPAVIGMASLAGSSNCDHTCAFDKSGS